MTQWRAVDVRTRRRGERLPETTYSKRQGGRLSNGSYEQICAKRKRRRRDGKPGPSLAAREVYLANKSNLGDPKVHFNGKANHWTAELGNHGRGRKKKEGVVK